MPWDTTTRYGCSVADGGLALVQDLLNTIAAGRPREADLLDAPGTAQEWADAALADHAEGRPVGGVELDDRGVDELRALRAELRAAVAAGGERDGAPAEVRTSGAVLALRPDGTVDLEPRGQGWRRLVGLVLVEVLEAQRADTWRRLKVCRNDRCGVAFYDRSRNNSGAWHDVRVCGNAVNLRASRARRRAAADAGR
ncbi:CGNR zinc finger domain-containing protein [Actinomycetospora chiangmaiensis]|uniref:CGNR zinc finger domain-containing protein n=1 Tax=Actinomycetospora chiangmaiensis TaxID=402650 RepID=UPI00037726C1|nr:CGNR zinc finger domain-containing protein [Actinomycetospora chiangmaiensis]